MSSPSNTPPFRHEEETDKKDVQVAMTVGTSSQLKLVLLILDFNKGEYQSQIPLTVEEAHQVADALRGAADSLLPVQ